MKRFCLIIALVSLFIANTAISQSVDLRGPTNFETGIIDGVVLNDEVPIRKAVPYEHVRLADYVWSKRVFSRIDSREKINHELFYPFDSFFEEFEIPKSDNEILGNPLWNRHQERYSLWTIILKHVMLGELLVYNVSDTIFKTNEDGYQFKYPLYNRKNFRQKPSVFFTDKDYRDAVLRCLAQISLGDVYIYKDQYSSPHTFTKTSQSFDDWWADPNIVTDNNRFLEDMINDPAEQLVILKDKVLRVCWKATAEGEPLRYPDEYKLQTSQGIVAYHIKEDWFFDKERSLLDKRIIAIAPVADYTIRKDDQTGLTIPGERGELVVYNAKGERIGKSTNDATFRAEMFWLYFPDLRDVMVNYFTYNNKSDAQWMSFDDLFFKRKFNSTIYRTSDKFDRNIEDYRFGIDALREAEKVKEEIRTWEHDVWNY